MDPNGLDQSFRASRKSGDLVLSLDSYIEAVWLWGRKFFTRVDRSTVNGLWFVACWILLFRRRRRRGVGNFVVSKHIDKQEARVCCLEDTRSIFYRTRLSCVERWDPQGE